MLDKLTDEQVKLMDIVRDEWLSLFFSGKEIDREAARDGIEWLYAFSGLKKPQIIFVDSPLGMQYVCNMVWNQVRSQVVRQVSNQVRNQVRDQVENQVRDQVGNQVRNQVESQVSNQVESQVRDKKLKYFELASYGNYSDFGWLSFYDFFYRIGVDLGTAKSDLKKFESLIKSGVYDMVQLDGLCVVSQLPKAVRRNAQNNMHSDKLPAIEFRDGYKLHYLNGVFFKEELWTEVVSGEMPFEKILAIEDVDQRTQAMRYADIDKFVTHANGELLDEYNKFTVEGEVVNYKLYKFPSGDIFTEDAYYCLFDCPSTRKKHMEGVEVSKTVPEAMAWAEEISEEDWKARIPLIHET